MKRFKQLITASAFLACSAAQAEIDLSQAAVMTGVGLNGLTIEAFAPLKPNMHLRVALSGAATNAEETQDGLHADADVKLFQLGGFFDYFPFAGKRFYLSGGLSYNQQALDARATSLNAAGSITSSDGVTTATLTDGTQVSIDTRPTGVTRITYGGDTYDMEEDEVYEVDGRYIRVVDGEVQSFDSPPDENSTPTQTESPEQLLSSLFGGTLITNISVDQKSPIAPYLGLGFRQRFGDDDRWVFDFNTGLLITGGMDVDINVICTEESLSCDILKEKIDSEIETKQDQIQTIEDLPGVWPVARLVIGYQF